MILPIGRGALARSGPFFVAQLDVPMQTWLPIGAGVAARAFGNKMMCIVMSVLVFDPRLHRGFSIGQLANSFICAKLTCWVNRAWQLN
jgi:hypothetical protein